MVIKALVFDFDGLILDTEGPVFQSWQELFKTFGYQLTLQDWEIVIGTAEGTERFFASVEDRIGGGLDLDAVGPQRLARELDLIAAQPIMPGVQDLLQQALEMGLKLGVASSSPCKWVTGHLEARGLISNFDCVLGADDVEVTKPDPDLYLAVLECLGVSPGEAIAFEDSPNGVLAAKRAGLYCVAVPNPLTSQLRFEGADLLLDSLEGINLAQLLAGSVVG
jgi:HAD superfamily hydrolase (TIGR01509 family)